MSIFVEDSAEPISSAYVEIHDLPEPEADTSLEEPGKLDDLRG
ncbi:hypothetical protein ABT061_38935 [Streptosporangium sp. NPDC002544]